MVGKCFYTQSQQTRGEDYNILGVKIINSNKVLYFITYNNKIEF